ncbi:hypothetical protein SFUMM280S_10997 [Streptomyces fumanus]
MTSAVSIRGRFRFSRASIASVSTETSGSPTGTPAASRTWAGVRTEVPETGTCSTRSQSEPYSSQSVTAASSTRTAAGPATARGRGGHRRRLWGGPDDSR